MSSNQPMLPLIKLKSSLLKMVIPTIAFLSCMLDSQAQEKDLDGYIKNAPFKMSPVLLPKIPSLVFSIDQYGGIPDGQTLNTIAFTKVIAACSESGGGRIEVPAGLWLTGPIELKSNIELHVQRGAIILFTKDHSQYPMIKASNSGNGFVTASPIYGYDLKNIAITGEGIIDGAGDSWRPVKKIKTTAAQWKNLSSSGVLSKDGTIWWPNKEAMEGEGFLKTLKTGDKKLTAESYLPAREFLRPYMLYLVKCENILLENVTLRNSPKFVFYPNHCTNLTMKYVTIFNEWWAQNGDGIDISACKNVAIYKCTVSAGDDGICMKSSGKSEGNSAALENVVIAGCNVYHAHGGFVIGSNTDGGMNNISVSDCNFIGTDVGIRIKSNSGRGGLVHNVFLNNIFMSDIVNEAILFDTYYEDVPAGTVKVSETSVIKDKIPRFEDFYLSNIYCNGAGTAISITGLPGMPVSRIFFDKVTISSVEGFKGTDANMIDLKKTNIICQKLPVFTLVRVKDLDLHKAPVSVPGK